jgi:tetratricopeptide (TPR) repeat protein
VAAELARVNFFRGEREAAEERVMLAIDVAERLWLPEWLSQALNTAGLIAIEAGRWEYGYALTERALRLALDNDLLAAALRAYNNLCNHLDERDRYEEDIELARSSLALARKVGARSSEWRLMGELSGALLRTGRWDEADEILAALPEEALPFGAAISVASEVALRRGRMEEARELLAIVERELDRADVQDLNAYLTMKAQILNAEGDHAGALASANEVIEAGGRIGAALKICYVEALTAAHALGDEDAVRGLLARVDQIPRGMLPPTLAAHAQRFRALLGDEPEQRFRGAAALLREYSLVPDAAVVDLEHAEWLVREARSEEAAPLVAEAREVFTRLGATPWLDRLDGLDVGLPAFVAEAK